MSSWISRATASHNTQLVTTAVISGVVVAGAILGFQKVRRQYMVEDLKASIPSISQEHVATRVIICYFFHGSQKLYWRLVIETWFDCMANFRNEADKIRCGCRYICTH